MIPLPLEIMTTTRGGSSYKYLARRSHMLRGTTPHCDVKTLRLDTRFHQHKEDDS